MIVRLRSGGYDALPGYDYRGPTHVSIGQEASPVGACSMLRTDDNVTSSHRGHGDAVAKGFAAIRTMDDEQLRARVPGSAGGTHEELLEAALEEHIYRVIAELFGKEEGYCAGRGGGMHIGDFSTGNLGANAIVGGSVPIATGAAMAHRYERSDRVVCCFAGDGAYANGVVLESLNWAAQAQWTNHMAGDRPYGLPVIYFIQNNHYGMTHRSDEEVMGVAHLAQRAAGFADNLMHAETVNGMDVLAVRDAVRRAVELCRSGAGPGPDRVQHLPLLRPLPVGPAQRVPDPGRGGRLAGDRPDRAAQGAAGRGRRGRVRGRRGRDPRQGAQRPRGRPRVRGDRSRSRRTRCACCTRTAAAMTSRPEAAAELLAPLPEAKRGPDGCDHLQGRAARRDDRGDGPRPARLHLRRGHRRVRRRVQAHQGPARIVRAGPGLQHADQRGRRSAGPPWAPPSSGCGRWSS